MELVTVLGDLRVQGCISHHCRLPASMRCGYLLPEENIGYTHIHLQVYIDSGGVGGAIW